MKKYKIEKRSTKISHACVPLKVDKVLIKFRVKV
jgi:hypothetical protein